MPAAPPVSPSATPAGVAPKTSSSSSSSPTKPTSKPLLLKNPDGSLSAGFAANYVRPKPPRSPRFAPSVVNAWLDEDTACDLELIYSRHCNLFLALLLIQLVVDGLFGSLYVLYADVVVEEMQAVGFFLGRKVAGK